MSDEGSCEGETADGNVHTDNQDSAQSGDPAVPPAPISRISVKHAVEVIQTFNEFKRFLVTSIGFGGMLDLQMLQKLNLKFSTWTMSKVSTTRQEQDTEILARGCPQSFWNPMWTLQHKGS